MAFYRRRRCVAADAASQAKDMAENATSRHDCGPGMFKMAENATSKHSSVRVFADARSTWVLRKTKGQVAKAQSEGERRNPLVSLRKKTYSSRFRPDSVNLAAAVATI